MIQIQNLSYLRNDDVILDQVNLEIKQGEQWIILGRNGAGKTSLINMIYGYSWPTSGIIKVFGIEYGSEPLRQIQEEIGILQSNQQSNLLQRNLTSLEIIISGLHSNLGIYREITEIEISSAKKLLEEQSLLHLSERNFQILSSREKSKILLLRSIIRKPKILILDEPTSSLDLKACYEFFNLLQSIIEKYKITCVQIVHRLEDIPKYFTHIAMMKQGRIVQSGLIDSILNLKNLSSLYELPEDWFQSFQMFNSWKH
jgi:iron complex transport system ATP-binding protein